MSNAQINPSNSGHHTGSFPPWRLLNGVINASDGEIENSIEACEWWATRSAAVVFAGVLIEIALAIWHPPYDCWVNIWGTATADVLVAAGIAGEVLFSRLAGNRESELRRRANVAIAAANERAADADRKAAEARERTAEVERLTAWRRITRDQSQRIADALRDTAESYDLLIECQTGDAEAFSFARDLMKVFRDAGVTKSRAQTNFRLLVPTFGAFICAASEVDLSIILKEFSDAGIQLIAERDDPAWHERGEAKPNLYIFVAPKPPLDM